ncbi:MAG: hypothetical protein LC102_09665 [Ignavibacteriales bacterium]|jgi:hypothetical protein|nr:MAG: hypothetical protein F9K26_01295 [Ignavibacteriaceae bacterium]MBW7872045.1 hypothetical protein [Ignavibacteria bacterium]MCZ2143680.1 hypothetical protein [Ignavibacteriales bacterium]OQY79713.1 MAG: hypothetical protein B6D45_00360 [Ignavibacteriales bacterium UTCHB3]MBV6446058.1 hypothetical protein [Ignavibacteriaceae bacterium]
MKKAKLFIFILTVLICSTSDLKSQVFSPDPFLEAYSNSLLYGDYLDHANLYWEKTFFINKWYDKQGIRRVAKNFYDNNETLEHRFTRLSHGYNREGDLEVIVMEYHKVRNRKTGQISSTTVKKKFVLYYWKNYYVYQQIILK